MTAPRRRRRPTVGQLDLLAAAEAWLAEVLPPRRPALASVPEPTPEAPARPVSWATAAAVVRGALRPPPAVPELLTVRVGRVGHLAPRWSEYALCGTPLGPVVGSGGQVSCPSCALPPEAD